MLKSIIRLYHVAKTALDREVSINKIIELPIMEDIARAKMTPEDKLSDLEKLPHKIQTAINNLK